MQDYYAPKSHYIPAYPANPQSRHLQYYYVVKSHYVLIIVSRLALPNPQSRHLLDIFKIIAFEIITQ